MHGTQVLKAEAGCKCKDKVSSSSGGTALHSEAAATSMPTPFNIYSQINHGVSPWQQSSCLPSNRQPKIPMDCEDPQPSHPSQRRSFDFQTPMRSPEQCNVSAQRSVTFCQVLYL